MGGGGGCSVGAVAAGGYWAGLKSRANYEVAGLERIVERKARFVMKKGRGWAWV